MAAPQKSEVIFASKVVVAVLSAYALCLALNLPQPQWAIITIAFVMNPLSGAARSRGIYRVAGTIFGAILAIALAAVFYAVPEIMLLLSGLIMLYFVYLQYMYNSPRNYVLFLGGLTVLLINLPGVGGGPTVLMETVIWRVLVITVGVGVAHVVDSIFFPTSILTLLNRKIDLWTGDVELWVKSILYPDEHIIAKDPRVLAAELEALDGLIFHVRFESAVSTDQHRMLELIRKRLLMLIPLITSLKDQLAEIRKEREHVTFESTVGLIDSVQLFLNKSPKEMDCWSSILEHNLRRNCLRLLELFAEVQSLRKGLDAVSGNERSFVLKEFSGEILPSAKHVDRRTAFLSVLPGVINLILGFLFWKYSGWSQAGTVFLLGSIMSVIMGTMDDPAAVLKGVARLVVILSFAAGILIYWVSPFARAFEMQLFFLAIPVFIIGLILAKNPVGAVILVLFSTNINFSNGYAPVPANVFIEASLATLTAFILAMFANALVRSFTAEWMVKRLIRTGHREILSIARGDSRLDIQNFVNLMNSKLAGIIQRLAAVTDSSIKTERILSDFQIGLALANLRSSLLDLSASARERVHFVLNDFASAGKSDSDLHKIGGAILLQHIDESLTAALTEPNESARSTLILSLSTLRLNLFSDSAGYVKRPISDGVGQ
ncbi:MAG: FUSC family protein [Bdellovibrionota bacterium]